MSQIFNCSRRDFCKTGALLGTGLVLGFYLPGCQKKEIIPPASGPVRHANVCMVLGNGRFAMQ
ncbi:MAG: hypothetical protein NT087_02330 [Deltaproteobacteria bacterium]|nr:hypothetical protein [Deltaproteobacteria bacterium]